MLLDEGPQGVEPLHQQRVALAQLGIDRDEGARDVVAQADQPVVGTDSPEHQHGHRRPACDFGRSHEAALYDRLAR